MSRSAVPPITLPLDVLPPPDPPTLADTEHDELCGAIGSITQAVARLKGKAYANRERNELIRIRDAINEHAKRLPK